VTNVARLAEAALFASATPMSARALGQVLPDDADADAILAELVARYAGGGIELVEVGGGWQFRTPPDLAAALRTVVSMPRRLPRVAMEVLAIIAYHQPCTRAEIEEIRGASLSQSTLEALLDVGLVETMGHREVAGRPALWGTTPAFLGQFKLNTLGDLPSRKDLLIDAPGAAA